MSSSGSASLTHPAAGRRMDIPSCTSCQPSERGDTGSSSRSSVAAPDGFFKNYFIFYFFFPSTFVIAAFSPFGCY